VVGYIPRWLTCPQAVTHRSINRARRTVTSLIRSDALPLHHAYLLFILVSWWNLACCVEENFELFWCSVMECCLYIIGFLTRLTSLSGIQ